MIAIVISPEIWLAMAKHIFIQQKLAKLGQFKRVRFASAELYLGLKLVLLGRHRSTTGAAVLVPICT